MEKIILSLDKLDEEKVLKISKYKLAYNFFSKKYIFYENNDDNDDVICVRYHFVCETKDSTPCVGVYFFYPFNLNLYHF